MSLPVAHKQLIQAVACVLAVKRYYKRWFELDAVSEFCDRFAPPGLVINHMADYFILNSPSMMSSEKN
jgi:hypothetical protein